MHSSKVEPGPAVPFIAPDFIHCRRPDFYCRLLLALPRLRLAWIILRAPRNGRHGGGSPRGRSSPLLHVSAAADRADERSRFYLEEYRKGYDVAYVVLKSADAADPHIRLKWIAAARILEGARRLIPKVTVKEHRDVLNMDIPQQSVRFQPFFENIAQYYYGVIPPNYGTGTGQEWLHEAARRSTQPKDGVLNWQRAVPEKALHTVWRAVQYPKGYAEVLGEGFDEGQVLFLPTGMRDYVEHSRIYSSSMGKLYDQHGKEVPGGANNDLIK